MYFKQLFEPGLAQYSYLIGCQQTGEALVVDPLRDVSQYLRLAELEGFQLRFGLETHIHADFVSGLYALASSHGVQAFLSGEGGTDWSYRWADAPGVSCRIVRHGDVLRVGKIELEAWHTPGHTPEHLSYLVTDRGGGADAPMGVLSGDFVFVADLGRPDLLESAVGQTGSQEPAARALFESAREFLKLPDFLQVWPAHGAGSACGKALGAIPASTVGYEKRFNLSLRQVSRGVDAFVESILQDQPEPPLYFARMKRVNRDGPALLGSLPKPVKLEADAVPELLKRRDVVAVDTRSERREFMQAHLGGSLLASFDKRFSGVAGSYLEPDSLILLIAEAERVPRLVRSLVRIGLDNVGWFIEPDQLRDSRLRSRMSSIPVTRFQDFKPEPGVTVLDVRGQSEYRAGHLAGALHIAHTRLAERYGEIPRQRPVAVYCRSGARAGAAAAYLASRGYEVVHIDDLVSNLDPAQKG